MPQALPIGDRIRQLYSTIHRFVDAVKCSCSLLAESRSFSIACLAGFTAALTILHSLEVVGDNKEVIPGQPAHGKVPTNVAGRPGMALSSAGVFCSMFRPTLAHRPTREHFRISGEPPSIVSRICGVETSAPKQFRCVSVECKYVVQSAGCFAYFSQSPLC
jgi:hypothetical protein